VVDAIIRNDAAYGLDVINAAVDGGADPRYFGRQVIEHLRNVLLIQMGSPNLVQASDEMIALMSEQAQIFGRSALLKTIRAFNTAVADLRSGWQPQLPLELALVESAKPVSEEEPVDDSEPQTEARYSRSAGAAGRRKIGVASTEQSQPEAESTSAISLDDVISRWGDLCKRAEKDVQLHALLPWHEPYRMDGDILVLGTSNEMLKPKMEKPQNMQNLEALVRQVFGEGVRVRIELVAEKAAGKRDRLPDEIANDEFFAFGVNELGAEISFPDE
jgi:DNA polymerase-3 subunit gamma/tau